MNMRDIIDKKKQGESLSNEEIQFVVNGITDRTVPDYQTSALLMAIIFQKMNNEETFALVDAMKNSGDVIDLSEIDGIKVDKHSTGGVGDKTTLIAAPIAAAAGVPIAKMSGRGLGITGGTVDKMESIPNFETSLTREDFVKQVNEIGIAVIGQTGKIAPADKELYALRDVTATVDNVSLISSSIMSKKLASGSDAIVLDVKHGIGSFMPEYEDAKELADLMCNIGTAAGKKTVAIISDMNKPLGKAIGNSLEVMEVIDVLKGNGPEDITYISKTLAGTMIFLGDKADSIEDGINIAQKMIDSGKALDKFRQFVVSQGGDEKVIDDFSLFQLAKHEGELISNQSGYVTQINARIVGVATQKSGAGRETKDSEINLGAGIVIEKQVGDQVQKGDVLARIYAGTPDRLRESNEIIAEAFEISDTPSAQPDLIREIVGI